MPLRSTPLPFMTLMPFVAFMISRLTLRQFAETTFLAGSKLQPFSVPGVCRGGTMPSFVIDFAIVPQVEKIRMKPLTNSCFKCSRVGSCLSYLWLQSTRKKLSRGARENLDTFTRYVPVCSKGHSLLQAWRKHSRGKHGKPSYTLTSHRINSHDILHLQSE